MKFLAWILLAGIGAFLISDQSSLAVAAPHPQDTPVMSASKRLDRLVLVGLVIYAATACFSITLCQFGYALALIGWVAQLVRGLVHQSGRRCFSLSFLNDFVLTILYFSLAL